MKNIYLVQPSNENSNHIFLPYSIGTIAAYAFESSEIKENYVLGDLIFRKDPLDKALETIKEPFLVGFSCYLWNVEYNLTLAEMVKEKYPGCIVAFGGPQIPDDTEYLEKYSFIDILMHGEGEITFASILENLIKGGNQEEINNISFRKNGECVKTERQYVKLTETFPSPYEKGYFDSIVNNPEYSHLSFETILETNRGCPYSCAYCCWAGTKENFRLFPIERVKKDLLWMAENKISYCICADSNFGILPRDMEITEYLSQLKKKYGYPAKFETSAAKNKDDFVFDINRKLDGAGLNCGVSIALQSMSPAVLKNIGRSNISNDNFRDQIKKYADNGISTYTDLILALPGETRESFCRAVFDVMEAGQHTSINVHPCEVLPNTVLYRNETREKYGIKTVKSTMFQEHSRRDYTDNFASRSEIIVETETMTRQEWLEILRLSTMVQSFHSFGLIRCVAVYLRREKKLSYYDFYMKFFSAVENSSGAVRRILHYATACLDGFIEGKDNIHFYDERFSDSYLSMKEGLFLCCAYELDEFFSDVKSIISGTFPEYFDNELLRDDLLEYQKDTVAFPQKKKSVKSYEYNWNEYFSTFDSDKYPGLISEKAVYELGECDSSDWYEYTVKNIWHGKRENKMLIKDIRRVTESRTHV